MELTVSFKKGPPVVFMVTYLVNQVSKFSKITHLKITTRKKNDPLTEITETLLISVYPQKTHR